MTKTTLSAARQMLGWTQTKLAQEVGTSISTINDLEHGRNGNPGYALVMKVIAALRAGGLPGVSPEDIFPLPDEKPSQRSA